MKYRFQLPKYWKLPTDTCSVSCIFNTIYNQSIFKIVQLCKQPLKKIGLVYVIINLCIKCARKFISKILYIITLVNLKKYEIKKFKKYVSEKGLKSFKLINSCDVQLILPKVYPSEKITLFTSSPLSYTFDSIDVVKLENAKVIGSSNIVFVDKIAICHDQYDFRVDCISEELHNLFSINAVTNTIKLNKNNNHSIIVQCAAIFLDSCAHNYAHWITEVLPRIAAFCKEDHFNDIPIIVDDDLHINLMESLGIIAGSDRKIFTLSKHQVIKIESLLLVSASGYVPFGVKSRKFSQPSHGVFNILALKEMRELILDKAQKITKINWPAKIYLARESQIRKHLNELDFERKLIDRGFVKINLDDLTFAEQVHLFSGARDIVAATGAGLVNAIFAPPGSKITVIMAMHHDMIYRYWLNMFSPLDLNITYILGNIVSKKHLGIHADFELPSESTLDYFADLDNA